MPIASLDEIRARIGEEDRRLLLALDRPGADRRFRRRDRGPAVHPHRPRGRCTDSVRRNGRARLSDALAALANGRRGMLIPDGAKMAVNYGLDRVRFLAPVRSGKRVRGRFSLDSVEEKAPGQAPDAPHSHGRDRRRGKARAHRPVARPDFHLRSSRMREAVIVSTARTPIGRAYRGAFNATPVADARPRFSIRSGDRACQDRCRRDRRRDHGRGAAAGRADGNIGRTAALRAGCPVDASRACRSTASARRA